MVRVYKDSPQALAYWASVSVANEDVFPVTVAEAFFMLPRRDPWTDLVCVWKRVTDKETTIVLSDDVYQRMGVLKSKLVENSFTTSP